MEALPPTYGDDTGPGGIPFNVPFPVEITNDPERFGQGGEGWHYVPGEGYYYIEPWRPDSEDDGQWDEPPEDWGPYPEDYYDIPSIEDIIRKLEGDDNLPTVEPWEQPDLTPYEIWERLNPEPPMDADGDGVIDQGWIDWVIKRYNRWGPISPFELTPGTFDFDFPRFYDDYPFLSPFSTPAEDPEEDPDGVFDENPWWWPF